MAKDATWVTVHRTGDSFDRKEDMVLSVVQQNRVFMEWKDDSHLSLDCRCRDEDVRLQVIKKGGVSISYR
jgi:hypothetical protein